MDFQKQPAVPMMYSHPSQQQMMMQQSNQMPMHPMQGHPQQQNHHYNQNQHYHQNPHQSHSSHSHHADEKWLTLDSNEIFMIRNDSLKRSNDLLSLKLQKEKAKKITNQLPYKELEESLRDEYSVFKKTFSSTREVYQDIINTKKVWQKRNAKWKSKLDKINKEIENSLTENVSEKNFMKYYLVDLMKKPKQPDEPLF